MIRLGKFRKVYNETDLQFVSRHVNFAILRLRGAKSAIEDAWQIYNELARQLGFDTVSHTDHSESSIRALKGIYKEYKAKHGQE